VIGVLVDGFGDGTALDAADEANARDHEGTEAGRRVFDDAVVEDRNILILGGGEELNFQGSGVGLLHPEPAFEGSVGDFLAIENGDGGLLIAAAETKDEKTVGADEFGSGVRFRGEIVFRDFRGAE
jgi:hypothetical protein